jgi:phage-related protein
MAQQEEWSIVFYTDVRGNEPVREFLRSLDLRAQARFAWSIEQLRVRNVQAREPLVRHIEGRIWELGRESTTNIYAVRSRWRADDWPILLHEEVNKYGTKTKRCYSTGSGKLPPLA